MPDLQRGLKGTQVQLTTRVTEELTLSCLDHMTGRYFPFVRPRGSSVVWTVKLQI